MADQKKLDRWADKLLDTGKRNNLISFKDTKASTAEVLYPSCESVFSKCAVGHIFEVFNPQIPDMDSGEFEETEDVVSNARTGRRLSRDEYRENYIYRLKSEKYLLIYAQTPNPMTAVKTLRKRRGQCRMRPVSMLLIWHSDF